MRTRDLKPGFFRNEALASLAPVVRLLYQGLWCIADNKGRLVDSVALIKADVFPFENIPVEKHLKTLAEGGFINRYEVGGKHYIWIQTFLNHQHPHPKETESVLPAAPEEQRPVHVRATEQPLPVHVQATEFTRPDHLITGKGNVTPGSRSDPSASHSNLSPLTSIPSIPSLSSVPSEPASSSTPRKLPLRTRLDLSTSEIAQLRKAHPTADINARWGEWILWIEEEEKKRMPENKIRAFEGWLKKPTPVGA